jgi:hypothetical protein
MQWDLGVGGLAYLGAMSLLSGAVASLVVGKGRSRPVRTALVTSILCLVAGAFVSEGPFGWATEEDLQPNIDGLLRDEVLPSCVLVTACVALLARYWSPQGWRGSAAAASGGEAKLPPRWFVLAFWHGHRALLRLPRGRMGLWRLKPGRRGALRLTTTGRRTGSRGGWSSGASRTKAI